MQIKTIKYSFASLLFSLMIILSGCSLNKVESKEELTDIPRIHDEIDKIEVTIF